ncbi:pyridoxal-dependent decarboxylase, exosortase A system-associated [Rheinheimera texasensis]|uniref:pyridoxal-dependent decarboxylase, exosortase A system-associated n=1 Tax=Rheinheimera texasensis TaxID=306205 RepID=UPI0032B215FC
MSDKVDNSQLSAQPQLAAALGAFSSVDGMLCIGGKTPAQIAAMLDAEVFYAYDRMALQHKVEQLRHALPGAVKLHYAVKANPYGPVVQQMAGLVDGMDVASRRELLLALQSGMPASHISFAGPGKTDTELAAAIAAGCVVHLESATEMRRLQRLCRAANTTAQVALRINPEFELKGAGMKMAGGAKAFGIDQHQVFALLDEVQQGPLQLIGFHLYCGSQNLHADAILQSQRQSLQLLTQLRPLCADLRFFNLGGGFGVPYFPADKPLDLDAVGAGMRGLLDEFAATIAGLEIVLELGRYLVADAGVYMSRVIDIKTSHGCTFVVTNGGLHHHLANSGNFGQVVRRNYPVLLANKLNQPVAGPLQVVGPLCTPLDVLADKVLLPEPAIGDWFAVLQSGAYGASASPQGFLSHGAVAEILL